MPRTSGSRPRARVCLTSASMTTMTARCRTPRPSRTSCPAPTRSPRPKSRLGADRPDLRRHQRLDRRQERFDGQHRPEGRWLGHLHLHERQGRPHHRRQGHGPGRRPAELRRSTRRATAPNFSLTDAAAPERLRRPEARHLLGGRDGPGRLGPDERDRAPTAARSTRDQPAAGETVTCTFTNTKRGHIIVDKVTVPGGDPQLVHLHPRTTRTGLQLGRRDGTERLRRPRPGTYSVAETVPAGWDLTERDLLRPAASQRHQHRLAAGRDRHLHVHQHQARHDHRRQGDRTRPATRQLHVHPVVQRRATFQLADATAPNDSGGLLAGTYTVAETVPGRLGPDERHLLRRQPGHAIGLPAGETVTCTFTNTKRGQIIVDKVRPRRRPASLRASTRTTTARRTSA